MVLYSINCSSRKGPQNSGQCVGPVGSVLMWVLCFPKVYCCGMPHARMQGVPPQTIAILGGEECGNRAIEGRHTGSLESDCFIVWFIYQVDLH